MKILRKYSLGVGDRFGHQAKAQLKAIIAAEKELGISITPVWNKSNREHSIIGTEPEEVRRSADDAVKSLKWDKDYFVDADHINLNTVDSFISSSDFFTIDVADFIGNKPHPDVVNAFILQHRDYLGKLTIPGIVESLQINEDILESFANNYLIAIEEAAKVYAHLIQKKGKGNFIPEVSFDETDTPQTPLDLFFILKLLADLGVEAQTIAPRFSGRFNKGVDYVGDVQQFEREFEQDLLVIKYAIEQFNLPRNLKLSVHSGSDKFAIYPAIGRLIKKHNAGIHIKTAGTTWLEEIAGLAISDGDGLLIAKEVYQKAFDKLDELTAPYASVIDIDKTNLPDPKVVNAWTAIQYHNALVHNQSCGEFNSDLRQLIHVGYKVAAQMGDVYYKALEKYEDNIAMQVFENIFERHIKRLEL